MNSPRETPSKIAQETLSYAMTASLLLTTATGAALITLTTTPLLPTTAAIALASALTTLLITPHIIAHWTNIPINILLGITTPKQTDTQTPYK